jgi:hypothetical protein
MRCAAVVFAVASVAAAAAAVALASAQFRAPDMPAVHIREVTQLTLRPGAWTTGRRLAPVPQVQCVGAVACSQYAPETVRCTNVGWDGVDVQWDCVLAPGVPEGVRLSGVTVNCEGYAHPQDDYIVAGSCAVTYTLGTEHSMSLVVLVLLLALLLVVVAASSAKPLPQDVPAMTTDVPVIPEPVTDVPVAQPAPASPDTGAKRRQQPAATHAFAVSSRR